MGAINNLHRWQAIELRPLAALEAVAECGSFAGAARELGYTQPAVSHQIATLERALGVRLLERPKGRRPVTPTDAGALLLRHAHRVVASLQAADADLAALAEGSAGTVRVGTFPSAGMTLLPGVLRRFVRRWPNIEVRLEEAPYFEPLLEGVAAGKLDLTFALLPVDRAFEAVEILRDPYVLLVGADSPLTTRGGAVGLREIARLPLIAYQRPEFGGEAHLLALGLTPNVVFRSDESAIVQALVGAGLGSALVPRLSVIGSDRDVVALLVPEMPPRTIVLTWHGDRYVGRAATAFIDIVREVAAQLNGHDGREESSPRR